jgi:uncharacterized protein
MTPIVVLDTNVWLDLFVFGDSRVEGIGAQLREGSLAAVRSSATDLEIARVMAREAFRAHDLDPRMQAWHALSRALEPDRRAPWRCTDPDDQKFLDLAVTAGARFLYTKDRALLRLASRARRAGLEICAPQAKCLPPSRPAAEPLS